MSDPAVNSRGFKVTPQLLEKFTLVVAQESGEPRRFLRRSSPEFTVIRDAIESMIEQSLEYASNGLTVKIEFKGENMEPIEHIMQFFAYEHLPERLQTISKPFCDLAHAIVFGDAAFFDNGLPRNPERTVALRKLLEAKDAAVRALLAK